MAFNKRLNNNVLGSQSVYLNQVFYESNLYVEIEKDNI